MSIPSLVPGALMFHAVARSAWERLRTVEHQAPGTRLVNAPFFVLRQMVTSLLQVRKDCKACDTNVSLNGPDLCRYLPCQMNVYCVHPYA